MAMLEKNNSAISASCFGSGSGQAVAQPSELDLTKTLTKGLPENTKLNLTFNKTSEKIEFITLENNHSGFHFSYSFNSLANKFHSGGVVKRLQGEGISKVAQRNLFKFFIENNVDKIETAAIGLGAYAWARMGFKPTEYGWKCSRKFISDRMEKIEENLKGNFTELDREQFSKISEVIKSEDPKSIWKIVDNKSSFLACDNLSWGKALILDNKNFPEELKSPDVGVGVYYPAEFDFEDEDCIDRAISYFYPNEDAPKISKKANGETALNLLQDSDLFTSVFNQPL